MIDLTQPGAYARTAGGNLERPDIQAPVVSWMAYSLNIDNGGGGAVEVWDKCRELWASAGIASFPWMHVRSMSDLQRLVQVGQNEGVQALGVNIEDVVSDKLSLKAIADYLQTNWRLPVHMATLAWVQNGQGWAEMSFAMAALEVNPGEATFKDGYSPVIFKQCVDHAHAEGLTHVTAMWGTKVPRSTYGTDYQFCHSLYTADDIPPTPEAWATWKLVGPCTSLDPVEADVPLTPTEKKKWREQLRRYCLVAQKYENLWHYTQQRPYTGLGTPASDTHYNDCSSYAAIAFYKAGRNSAVKVDDPLGYNYTGWGNTGSAFAELKKYKAPRDKYRIGDIALYLEPGGFGDHMTVCIQAGDGESSVWSSFGSEAGPDERKLHYRSDLTNVYRPEDLR